jgi:anaerobic magnesium-protoporphyrin IX monomethyl ester cyclase
MQETIGIIAPAIDTHYADLDADFRLRLRKTNQELSLYRLYQLLKNVDDVGHCTAIETPKEDPPPGGLYLSAFLRSAGYNTIVSTSTEKTTFDKMRNENIKSICISSTMILSKSFLKQIVDDIRRNMGDIFIIVGGVFILKSYNVLLQMSLELKTLSRRKYDYLLFPCNKREIDADVFIVSQHGSDILLRVLMQLNRGRKADFHGIQNIALPDESGNFVLTKQIPEAVDYNKDFTRWDLLDQIPIRIPIRTSINCPHKCLFCDFRKISAHFFMRSKESILEELKLIGSRSSHRLTSYYYLIDENCFANEKQITMLCEIFGNLNKHLPWGGLLRASSITKENITMIKNAGLSYSFIGVESGDNTILQNMKKGQNVQDIKNGIELLADHDITTDISFIVGFPGETEQSVNNTVNFINNLKVTKCGLSLYPLIITPLAELLSAQYRDQWGITGMFRDWKHKTMSYAEAVSFCFYIFKRNCNIPYTYFENMAFNGRFDTDTMMQLQRLRKNIVVGIIEHQSLLEISPYFQELQKIFKLPLVDIKNKLLSELKVNAVI